MKTVLFPKEFFEKFKEKVLNSKEFTIDYRYNPRSNQLLSFACETEDFRIFIHKDRLKGCITLSKVIKENGKIKQIIDKNIENAEFDYRSLSVVEESVKDLIRSLKSKYQCNKETSECEYSLIEYHTFTKIN